MSHPTRPSRDGGLSEERPAEEFVRLSVIGEEPGNRFSQQIAFARKHGLTSWIPRFLIPPRGRRKYRFGDLPEKLLTAVQREVEIAGLRVHHHASPLGKIELASRAGMGDPYRSHAQYRQYIRKIGRACRELGVKAVRIFSGYPFDDQPSKEYLALAILLVREIVTVLDEEFGLSSILEVEPNLVGRDAESIVAIFEAIDRKDRLGVAFDPGNITVQGIPDAEMSKQFLLMLPSIVVLHAKFHPFKPDAKRSEHGRVDENQYDRYCTARLKGSPERTLFEAIRDNLYRFNGQAQRIGLDRFEIQLEPHMSALDESGEVVNKAWGGTSGPENCAAALRAVRAMCDDVGMNYVL